MSARLTAEQTVAVGYFARRVAGGTPLTPEEAQELAALLTAMVAPATPRREDPAKVAERKRRQRARQADAPTPAPPVETPSVTAVTPVTTVTPVTVRDARDTPPPRMVPPSLPTPHLTPPLAPPPLEPPPPAAADAAEWREWVEPGLTLRPDEVEIVRHHRALYPRRGPIDRATHKKLRKALGAYPPARILAALDGAHRDPWCRETRNLGLAYVVRDFATLDKYADKADSPPAGDPATPGASDADRLFARFERAGLLTFDNRDAYMARVAAAANGEGVDAFKALVRAVRPWELATHGERRFAVGELARRLAARPVPAATQGAA